MTDARPRHLSLTLEGRLLDQTGVVSFRGEEEANRLYRIDVDFTTTAHDERLEEILLRRGASLSMHEGAEVPRSFHGIVAAVDALGASLHDRRVYRLRLVPRMWLLKQRRARRVFAEMSALDVAAMLFAEHEVPHRLRISRNLPKRPYCAQYDETDYAFLKRLFAEDGLFFTFDHPRVSGGSHLLTSMGQSEVVVIADAAESYVALDGGADLRFARAAGAGGLAVREDHVISFAPRATLRSNAARVRGYDHRRPPTDLRAEVARDPKTSAVTAAISPALERSTVATFEGSYEDTIPIPLPGMHHSMVPGDAGRRLEALRARARVVDGASFCKRLVPGRKLTLHDHELPAIDGGYVVTRVEHEGYSAEVAPPDRAVYQCRFSCLPDTVPMRPKALVRRPRATSETAVVVGPPGQEIHTDDLGRVRVRFFWDIAGRRDEQATCWLRVSQPWAGVGFGALFVPRVGMEVVVTYLDGDPDKPLVTGCVYNATHPPPFPLPHGATQSGIRTSTTPGGAGANELRFEDRRGEELVHLQAQRDMTLVVSRARTQQIGMLDSLRVAGDRVEAIRGNARRSVEGMSSETVAGAVRRRVGGSEDHEVEGSLVLSVDGAYSIGVDGDLVEHVGGSRATSVGAPGETGAVSASHVHGDHVLSASGKVKIKCDAGLVLQCGDSVIEVTKAGIKLSGPSVSLSGKDGVSMKGKGPSLDLGADFEVRADKMRFFAKDSWLSLDKHVRVKGETIKLNCDDEKPSSASIATAAKKKKKLSIKLSDATFTAFGGRKFQLVADGDVYEGTTTADGIMEKEVPEDVKSLELAVWIGEYPTGEKRTWTLTHVEMPPPTDVRGAQLRLSNLGYHHGPATGILDGETMKSLASFQTDCELPPTGALDEATAGKLAASHGS